MVIVYQTVGECYCLGCVDALKKTDVFLSVYYCISGPVSPAAGVVESTVDERVAVGAGG